MRPNYLHQIAGKWQITRTPSAIGPYKRFDALKLARRWNRSADAGIVITATIHPEPVHERRVN